MSNRDWKYYFIQTVKLFHTIETDKVEDWNNLRNNIPDDVISTFQNTLD